MTVHMARAAFPPGSYSASAARRFVTATLHGWGRDDLTYVAVLLVGELVANVVLHAGTAFDVVIYSSDQRVRVEVCDSATQLPTRKHYSVTSTTGRGLMLVEDLAASWGVQPTADGKYVWFELDDTAATAASQRTFDLRGIDFEDFGPDAFPPGPSGVHLDGATQGTGADRSAGPWARRRHMVATG